MSQGRQSQTSRSQSLVHMISFSIRFHELMLCFDQSAAISGYGSSKETIVAEQEIRFDDGAAYEQMMGIWSRIAGDVFIDWLAPRSGLSWIDVGCGNGALPPPHGYASLPFPDQRPSTIPAEHLFAPRWHSAEVVA